MFTLLFIINILCSLGLVREKVRAGLIHLDKARPISSSNCQTQKRLIIMTEGEKRTHKMISEQVEAKPTLLNKIGCLFQREYHY